jgi:hypothetical protein
VLRVGPGLGPTNAAPCDPADLADVVLTSSADGGALRLEATVDGVAPVDVAGAFTVGDFAVVVAGVVSAVDCRV